MEDPFDHIEAYLSGNLSAADHARFEALMAEDQNLRDKVAQQKQLLHGIEMGFNRELKDLLVEEESRLPARKTKENSRIRSLFPVVGMAAAVAIFIVAFFIFRNNAADTSELYARYYQPYPNLEQPVTRSAESGANPYALYERAAYAEALAQFSALKSDRPDDPAILFYSAICQLELGSTDDAVTLFKELLGLEDNKYTRPAKWYLAMAHLKSDQASNAISVLNELTGMDDAYAQKADQILTALQE